MIKRMLAIVAIFTLCSAAWMVLGATMAYRTNEAGQAGGRSVVSLWGGEHTQEAPDMTVKWDETIPSGESSYTKEHTELVNPISSDIKITLDMDYRKKGFLWFPTYENSFEGSYVLVNPRDQDVKGEIALDLPSCSATYDDLQVTDGKDTPIPYKIDNGTVKVEKALEAHEETAIRFSYRSKGLETWHYSFGNGVQSIKDFELVMVTSFDEIDFPEGTLSPDEKHQHTDGPGWELEWKKSSMVNGKRIGMILPQRVNPGELSTAMSTSAPIGLLFFLALMLIFQVKLNLPIHPINYAFLAASFFAFNLLFSYLVDHASVGFSFTLSAIVSIGLIVPYLGRALGWRFALVEAGLSQVCFQLLFALAHFLKGFTGLSVTIGAIITLAVMMHSTAKVKWGEVLSSK